jgi:hypothetical protein
VTATEPQFKCQFCDTGFTYGDFHARQCHTRYHLGCIRIGTPFTTRLAKGEGLYCPHDLASQQQFICEACTVRSVLEAELGFTAEETVCLMLERARLVGTSNKWSKGTLRTYKSKFNVLRDFEKDLHVRVIPFSAPEYPPNGTAIRLMWAQERYSLYPSDWWRKQRTSEAAIKFGTIRALRSAASHLWTLDLLQNKSEQLTFGFRDRPQMVEACSPTDQIAYSYFTEGLRRRLGDNPTPSTVLLGSHMKWIDQYYDRLYRNATSAAQRAELSRAGVTHLASYLGWLRGMDTFGLHWQDLALVLPADGPSIGLPPGCGVVQLTLLEQTKSSQFAKADVVIAYMTAWRLSLGRWICRLQANLPAYALLPGPRILAHPSGAAWTSHYYRHKYLYPTLAVCRALGDPFLRTLDNTPGNTILERFWSFNTQRRSGRSEVSRKRRWTLRAATNAEVVDHGRWRISRSTLDMPLAYLEWSVEDRSCVTAFCM